MAAVLCYTDSDNRFLRHSNSGNSDSGEDTVTLRTVTDRRHVFKELHPISPCNHRPYQNNVLMSALTSVIRARAAHIAPASTTAVQSAWVWSTQKSRYDSQNNNLTAPTCHEKTCPVPQDSEAELMVEINKKIFRLHQRQRFLYDDLEGMLRNQAKSMKKSS